MAKLEVIKTEAELEAIYGKPVKASLTKVVDHLTPEYRAWITASKFCVLSTVGPEGTDATPRGDDGPVVQELDAKTLLMPDWAGNNRIDNLRNIVRDDRVSLMFFVQGDNNVVRVNGRGVITADEGLRRRFAKGEKLPKTVLCVTITEAYFQCAKAMMRAGVWDPDAERPKVPTAGDFLKAASNGKEGGAAYDAAYEDRAKNQFWEREY